MKFENTNVYNFESAFRGMRNPKNSWDKSDSFFGLINIDYTEADSEIAHYWVEKYHPEMMDESGCILPKGDNLLDEYSQKLIDNGILKIDYDHSVADVAFIGPNDMKLAQTLIKAGPEHRKFLRQIFVSVGITAPLYW